MRFALLPLALILFCVPVYADFSVELNGADPSASASVNTVAIQATLDTAGLAGGGTVTVTKAGIYLIGVQGANPYGPPGHKYCLDFKYDNITFSIGPGVTLKLANGQQVNGAPVDLLVYQGRKNLSFIGASNGSSTITGNTAGQTGWTQGYSQIDHGIIISSYGVNGGQANSNILIKNLSLTDHFSNPINMDTFPSSQRNSNIRIEGVRSSDCGEGIQVGGTDGVWIEDSVAESPNHVAVGDAIELSNCTRFFLKNNIARNHRSGSGFDIFGSTDGIIDGWISDDNANGMDIHAFGADQPDPKNVTAINGLVINSRDVAGTGVCTGLSISAPTLNNIKVKTVLMKGSPFFYGFQLGAGGQLSAVGPVVIEDCVVDGGMDGILIAAGFSDLTIKGGSYSNLNARGIVYAFQGNGITSAQLKNLTIDGVKAVNNGSYGILIDNQGYSVPGFSGVIKDCYLADNGDGPLSAGPEGLELTVENILPNTRTVLGDFWGTNAPIVYGVKYLSPTGGLLRSFRSPSKNQTLTVTFPEPTIVYDARQSGGNNIYLSKAVNGTFTAGDTLSLRYDSATTRWLETGRSLNTP